MIWELTIENNGATLGVHFLFIYIENEKNLARVNPLAYYVLKKYFSTQKTYFVILINHLTI